MKRLPEPRERPQLLDGRALPKDSVPYFKSYSVGHWEGDTLLVETVGLKEGLWLDGKGKTVSEEARLTHLLNDLNGSLIDDMIGDGG